MKVIFCPLLPDICMSIAFSQDFLTSPICPSDDEDMKYTTIS